MPPQSRYDPLPQPLPRRSRYDPEPVDEPEELDYVPPLDRLSRLAKRGWEAVNTSFLPQAQEYGAASAAAELQRSQASDDPNYAWWSGLKAGVTEGAGNLVSGLATPLNLGAALLSGGSSVAARSGLRGAALGLSAASRATGAPVAAHGAYQAATGGTWGDRALGVAEMAGGAAQMFTGAPRFTRPQARVWTPDEMASARTAGRPQRVVAPGLREAAAQMAPEPPRVRQVEPPEDDFWRNPANFDDLEMELAEARVRDERRAFLRGEPRPTVSPPEAAPNLTARLPAPDAPIGNSVDDAIPAPEASGRSDIARQLRESLRARGVPVDKTDEFSGLVASEAPQPPTAYDQTVERRGQPRPPGKVTEIEDALYARVRARGEPRSDLEALDEMRAKQARGEPTGTPGARQAFQQRQRLDAARRAAAPEPIDPNRGAATGLLDAPAPEVVQAPQRPAFSALDPAERAELRAIYAEMDAQPFQPWTITQARGVNAGKGNTPDKSAFFGAGHAGAPVVSEIQQASGRSVSGPALKAAIKKYIEGMKAPRGVVLQDVLDVAKKRATERAAGGTKGMSPDPHWDTDAPVVYPDKPVVDVNEFGEGQPRLPGAEGVRDVEVPTPEFEAPFTLNRENVARPQERTPALFDDTAELAAERAAIQGENAPPPPWKGSKLEAERPQNAVEGSKFDAVRRFLAAPTRIQKAKFEPVPARAVEPAGPPPPPGSRLAGDNLRALEANPRAMAQVEARTARLGELEQQIDWDNPGGPALDEWMALTNEQAARAGRRSLKLPSDAPDTPNPKMTDQPVERTSLGTIKGEIDPALLNALTRTGLGGVAGSMTGDEGQSKYERVARFLAGATAGVAGPKALKAGAAALGRLKPPPVPPRTTLAGAKFARSSRASRSASGPDPFGGKPAVETTLPPLRKPHPDRDLIPLIETMGTPERVDPAAWKARKPFTDEFDAAMRADNPNRPTTAEAAEALKTKLMGGGAKKLDQMAAESFAAGKKRQGRYRKAMAAEMRGDLTSAESFIDAYSGGILNPRRQDKIAGGVARQTHRALLAFGVDTAAKNLTQPLLALPHVGPRRLVEGFKMRKTPEGQALLAQHLKPLETPVDQGDFLQTLWPGDPAQATKIGAAIDKFKASPIGKKLGKIEPQYMLRKTDELNRQGVFLAARQHALAQGAKEAEAVARALEIVRKTQGDLSFGSMSPHWRGAPIKLLKPFQKFTTLFAEMAMDVPFQPDKAGQARTVAALAAASGLTYATGLNFWEYLTGARPSLMMPIPRAAYDLYKHGTGDADHTLSEDALSFVAGRFPEKAIREGRDFLHQGTGTHQRVTKAGDTEPHTALEGAASLVGLKSTRQTDISKAFRDMVEASKELTNERNQQNRATKRKIQQAILDGDFAGAEAASKQLSPKSAAAWKARRNLTRTTRFLKNQPPEIRRKLQERYGAQLRALEIQ